MRREINEDKQIKINGQIVSPKQLHRWRYDNGKDNPFSSIQNECRWRSVLSVKTCWETLDADVFLNALSDDFEYGSYWVNVPMRGVDAYTEYIKGKFSTISNANSKPELSIVVLREGITPADYTYALLLKQGTVECLLLFGFKENKIVRLYMTDPDIYAFDSYRVGILDTNGEPRMFKHTAAERTRKAMTPDELLAFAVEITGILLNERGMKIISVYPKHDIEYPNVVYEENGTRCFVRLLPFSPPAINAIPQRDILAGFINFAHEQNALAIIQPIGLFCMETMGETALSGGTFAVKFPSEIIG